MSSAIQGIQEELAKIGERIREAEFFTELRRLNIDRCENAFHHSLDGWSGLEWGGAVAGEVGELCNILKKVRREEQGIGGSRVAGDVQQAIADEIADVVIYCDLLAASRGIDLQRAIRHKFNETSKKVGFEGEL